MELITFKAQQAGAKKLYISSSPSEDTVNFYLKLRCVLIKKVDKRLLELKPMDIPLELNLN